MRLHKKTLHALKRPPSAPQSFHNQITYELLGNGFGAGGLEGLDELVRLVLAKVLLDSLWRGVDESLGLGESQARCFAHGLDDVDLARAHSLEDDVEFGLLDDRRSCWSSSIIIDQYESG